jgi:hypothetical protein
MASTVLANRNLKSTPTPSAIYFIQDGIWQEYNTVSITNNAFPGGGMTDPFF